MQNRRERIIAIVVAILALVTVCLTYIYASVPRLPLSEKKRVEKTHFEELCNSDEERYATFPIIWYDENWYTEETNVWRYIGTYGCCYAFLVIEDNKDWTGGEYEVPIPIQGLSREVYYPREAVVVLYHTLKDFSFQEVFGYDNDKTVRMYSLDGIVNRDEWISDWQLERLTRDIEKLAKAHN